MRAWARRALLLVLLLGTSSLALATTVTDTFNRSNGSLGANWTAVDYGNGGPQILSNQVRAGTSAYRESAYSASSVSTANYDVTVEYRSGSAGVVLVWGRGSGTGATKSGYAVAISNSTYALSVYTNDTETSLIGSTSWTSLSAGDIVGIRVNGSTISVIKNGAVVASVTNSTWTTGDARIGIYDPDNVTGPVIDNFSWADYSTTPTFSTAPAIGTRTTSSIPVTATSSCTDCTLYVVAVTDGSGAPTAAQIKAGNNSSGTAAYKSCSAAMTTTVQATCTLSTYTDGTVRDLYAVMESTIGGYSAVTGSGTLTDAYKLPAFTVAPSVSARSTTAYTVSKTLDGPGTVYCVAVKVTDSAPSVAQVEAGNNAAGTGAFSAASANATATLSLSSLNQSTRPLHSLYCAGTYGSQHQASVAAITFEILAAPAGKQFVTADVPWTGLSVYQGASPAIVDGDIASCDALSSPDSYPITLNVDGTVVIDSASDRSRQSLVCNLFDVSVDAWTGTFYTYINNVAPVQTGSPNSLLLLVQTGVAITSQNLASYFFDQEGDALTIAISPVSPNSIPTGLSLGGNVLSGSITNAGTYNLKFRVTDVAGDYLDSGTITYTAVGTQTFPNVVGQSVATAISNLNAVYIDVPGVAIAYRCSGVVSLGQVIATSPTAGTTVNPFSQGALVASNGPCARQIQINSF